MRADPTKSFDPEAEAELFARVQGILRQIERVRDQTLPKSLARQAMLGLATAEYIRVSSEPQAKNYGPTSQKTDVRYACEQFGFTRPSITFEDHISASGKLIRSDFVRMLDLARAGLFKILIVGRIDRFGRNEPAGWLYMAELVRLGVYVYFCDDDLAAGLDQDWQDGFSRGLHLAAGWLRRHRKNIQKSVRDRRTEGVWIGPYPFGWRGGHDRKPEYHPDEIGTVDRIVELALTDKHTCLEIADLASSEGHRGRRDRPLTKTQVYEVLTNPILMGGWRIHGPDGREIVLPDKSPARIEPGQWARLREMLTARRKGERRPKQRRAPFDPVFEHLLRCGEIDPATQQVCGAAFIAMRSRKANGSEQVQYLHVRGKGCCAEHHNRTWAVAQRTLIDQIDPRFADAGLPEVALERVGEFLAQEAQQRGPDVATMRADLEHDLERVNLLFKKGHYGKDPKVAAPVWERERAAIETQIAALPEPPAVPTQEQAATVRDLPEVWAKASPSERHEILTTLFQELYVTRDGGRSARQNGRPLQRGRQLLASMKPRPEYELLLTYAFHDSMSPDACPRKHEVIPMNASFSRWLKFVTKDGERHRTVRRFTLAEELRTIRSEQRVKQVALIRMGLRPSYNTYVALLERGQRTGTSLDYLLRIISAYSALGRPLSAEQCARLHAASGVRRGHQAAVSATAA